VRRLHQPRSCHLVCSACLHHELYTVLFAISCFSSVPCLRLITMTHPRAGHSTFPTRGCVITPTSRREGGTLLSLTFPSLFLSSSRMGIMVRTILSLPRVSFTPIGQAGCMSGQSRRVPSPQTTPSAFSILYPQHDNMSNTCNPMSIYLYRLTFHTGSPTMVPRSHRPRPASTRPTV